MKYGYVRVSSKDQNIDRQIVAMKAECICDKNIFIDRQSGKDFQRPQYQKMLKKLKENDVLFVKSIDRLGRNYDEIIEQWNLLTKKKKIKMVVIDFPLLDTRQEKQGITGQFIADLVLQILSYVAQIERENIHQRQAEGIREAKARGVKFGRPKREVPQEFVEFYNQWQNGQISKRKAAQQLGTSHSVFTSWIQRYEHVKCKKRPKKVDI